MWPGPQPHPNSWHTIIDQQDSKKKQATEKLALKHHPSVMCKEDVRKLPENTYRLDVQSRTYRPDLSFCRMLLDAYFVTSKFGLLNVNNFSLVNFVSLIANLKLLNINLMLLNTNFKLLNIKIICWTYKIHLLTMKIICQTYKKSFIDYENLLLNIKKLFPKHL